MLDLQVSHSLYNVPVMLDKSKRPLVLSVIFDEIVDRQVKELESIVKANTDKDNIEGLLSNGYDAYILTIPDVESYILDILFKAILEMEAQGYEIHQITIEDLSRMSNKDDKGNPQSMSTMLSRVRDFFKPKGTLVITTCELGEDAQQLRNNVPNGYLDKAVAINSYKHGSRLEQTVDTLILTSLDTGVVTMCCVKNRGSIAKMSYTTYGYVPDKGVLFDVGGESKAMSLTRLPISWYNNLI